LSTTALLVGHSEFLDANPDAAKALVRALYRAYQYASADPEKAYEILSTDLLSAAIQKSLYSYSPNFSIYKPEFTDDAVARIEGTNAFLTNQQLISEKVDLEKFVDKQYYEAVKGEFA
jgi:sulfonate transport system substrate-binding protein